MKNTERIKLYFGLLTPFARLWQDYLNDNSRGNYIDFWQWAYKRQGDMQECLAEAHKALFVNGKLTWDVPIEIDTRHFVPTIQESWGLFALPVSRCSFCKTYTLPKIKGFYENGSSAMSQAEQMKAAGMRYRGSNFITSDIVCEQCVADGKIHFKCAFCEETRNSELYHDAEYGDPICKICYETLTAKEWDEKMKELHEIHRYDYQ